MAGRGKPATPVASRYNASAVAITARAARKRREAGPWRPRPPAVFAGGAVMRPEYASTLLQENHRWAHRLTSNLTSWANSAKALPTDWRSFAAGWGSTSLLDVCGARRLHRLESQLLDDKVCRGLCRRVLPGKTGADQRHLFAHYGRRIMPASPGRTTHVPHRIGL